MHKVWKKFTREQAIARSKPVLAAIPFVGPPETESMQKSGTKDDCSSNAVPDPKPKHRCAACQSLGFSLNRVQHKVLEDICEYPEDQIEDRRERLNLSSGVESSNRRALTLFTLIEYIGSLGNRRLFFAASKNKGRRWAEAHGIKIASEHGNSIHTFLVKKSEQKLSLACPGMKFERRRTGEPAGVRPDTLGISPGAKCRRIAIQATVGNKPKGEAVNLLKLCGVLLSGRTQVPAGIDLVMSMAANKRIQKSIERAIRELNNDQVPPNIVFFNAEKHLLAPSFDWSILMEREI